MKTFDTLPSMTTDGLSNKHITQKAIPTTQRIYRFIVQSICSGELTPTIREIQQALHIAWIGDVHYHLTRLEARGLLTRQARCVRGLRVPLLSPVTAEGNPGVALTPLDATHETTCGLQLRVCTNNYQAAHILPGDRLTIKPALLHDGIRLVVLHDPLSQETPPRLILVHATRQGEHDPYTFVPLDPSRHQATLTHEEWSRDWAIIGAIGTIIRWIPTRPGTEW